MKIISLNVNGLNNNVKRKKILQQLNREKGDILFLQETHLTQIEHKKLSKVTNAQIFSSSFNSKRRGVATIIKSHIPFEKTKCIQDKEGRFVMVIGKIETTEISLINVYYPPEEGSDLMTQLIETIITQGKGIIIIGGDFNLTLQYADSTTRTQRTGKTATLLRKISAEIGLVDIWRSLHPTTKDYTYYSGRFSSYSRLDYFFMFKKDTALVKQCHIGTRSLSDHATVMLKISLNLKRGKNLWRMNNSLLQDLPFKEKINKCLKDYYEVNDTGEVNKIMVWEGAKAVLRGEIIAYASAKKRRQEQLRNELEIRVKVLEDKHKLNPNNELMIQLKKKRSELDKLRTEEIERTLTFTKQRHYDGGPNSIKILAYKLKKQSNRSHIAKLKDETNTLVTEKEEIAETFAKFYENLYKDEEGKGDAIIGTYLGKLKLKQVTPQHNETLIKPITTEEIFRQINKLKKGKTPGDDGYTNEFYQEFRELLIPILHKVYNSALESNNWAPTWNSSVITVIPKEGKDPTECSSYRPIALLNTDQKIISSIIAERLKEIMETLINRDQCGFVPNRYLADNIRRTLNIMEYSQKEKKDLLLLTIDAEKAFDRVLWPFIFNTAEAFGFHQKFIDWLKLMYKNPVAQVKVNGTLSRRLRIHKGTRQGDPLSGSIFAMCMESLAEAVRQQNRIKGVNIGHEEHKLAMYADDVIMYITSPETTLPALKETIKEYSELSGYKINETKCESITVGNELTQTAKSNFNLKWNQDKIKYLGIFIHKDLNKMYDANYQLLEDKIKRQLSTWKIIPESLLSRIDTIKMMILPQFLFLFQTLPIQIPNTCFQRWNGLITNFIWNYKRKRIKFKKLIKTKECGGLDVPNLKNYFNATQINTIMTWTNDRSEAKWVEIEKELTPMSLRTLPYIDKKEVAKIKGVNTWIYNTLKTWGDICKQQKINKDLMYFREMAWDPEFEPNKTDNILQEWAVKGLKIFLQMLTNDTIQSFETLVAKYRIPQRNFYKYLQVRAYLLKFLRTQANKETHPLIHFLIKSHKMTPKNTLSKVYKILQNNNNMEDSIHVKWNLEIGDQINEEEWKQICSEIHKTTNSKFWREFAWKLYTRFFITPNVLSKINKSTTSECWRKCGEMRANHSHIFFFCPGLAGFWQLIMDKMKSIFKFKNRLNPINIILGKSPPELTQEIDKYLYRILRTAALKQITRNWLKPLTPPHQKWKETVQEIMEMERITFRIRNKESEFNKRWNKWINDEAH